MRKHVLRLLAAAAALASSAVLAQLPVVPGEPALGPKATTPAQLRLPPEKATGPHVALPAVPAAAIEAIRAKNRAAKETPLRSYARRTVIGLVRDMEVPAVMAGAVQWRAVPGGHAAQVSLTSPEAEALRLGIDLLGVPVDVELVFFGNANPWRLEGPVRVGDIADRGRTWWSPITEGDTQTVEFFVPQEHDPRSMAPRVTAASHLLTTPSSAFTKRMEDLGRAGACNVDVPCSELNTNPAFQQAAESVAQMVFNDGSFTTLCSGTLLNDTVASSQIPWFYSANHCFENENAPYKTPAQMQAVANTLTTIWGFVATACGNRTPRSGWSQVGGGATLIYNNVGQDVLFLRLNGTPPSNAFFSGWDANTMPGGSSAVTIHHPQGDLKKVSQGTMQRFSQPGVGGQFASFIEIRWNSGTTEPGSSGGGLWTFNGSQYLFRGGLWGGTALCTNTSGTDHFSRFDVVYPSLAAYLAPANGPSANYTDLWWNPSESGWGLNLLQMPSGVIFGVWYTYADDGKRTWYVIPEGQWTTANSYTGPIYHVSGPPYTGTFDPNRVIRNHVGSATLTFSDVNNGTFQFNVNGITGNKPITRLPF